MKHHRLLYFCAFLILTVLAGLVLRWQLAGVSIPELGTLDWRRAHSHLGFYGVLFPLAWICLQELPQARLPSPRGWLFYSGLVAFGGLAFLWQGYGLFSIAASTGILAVWLLFAWQNRPSWKFWQARWLTPASLAIFLSAGLIGAVAIKTKTDPALANQLARAFLSLLLFGVFLPATLTLFAKNPPQAGLWFLATLMSALFLTELVSHPILGLGPAWLAFEIFKIFHSPEIGFKDWKLRLAWMALALGLISTGLRLTPYSYFQAIAGVHFLILGPLLMSFALVRLRLQIPGVLRWSYELSLVAMVTSIGLQNFVKFSLAPLTAWSSSVFVVTIGLILGKEFSKQKS